MRHCLRCHAGNLRPSRPKWAWELLRRQFTQSCLYRCDRCGWRGWGLEWMDATASAQSAATNDLVVPHVPEDDSEPVLAAAPAGLEDLDFHVLNIPPKSGRELR